MHIVKVVMESRSRTKISMAVSTRSTLERHLCQIVAESRLVLVFVDGGKRREDCTG